MFKFTFLILFSSFLAGSDSEEIKVIIERNVPVPMRDGTILRADIHRPDRGGPYPVLVQRTPYRKIRFYDEYIKAGYIVVCQYVRGRYGSGGRFESMCRFETHEAEDGYDTVEWAAKLPGSTGKVGTFGISYEALEQWRLAALNPPSLVAMCARSVAAKLWQVEKPCTLRPGTRLEWLAKIACDMRRRENLPGVQTEYEHHRLWEEKSDKWIHWLPLLDLPQDFFGYETDVLKAWLRNPHADPWRLDEKCKDITVPNLDIVGWFDFANGDMLHFRTMVKEAKTETARKGSRIIIGPWPHGSFPTSYGNIDFGPTAVCDRRGIQIRWFDYWLKGKQNGVDKDSPVRIFVMGDNKWRDESCWPLQRTRKKVLFLNSDGSANTPSGDGKLVVENSGFSKTDKYIYDPTDPVPTLFGKQFPMPTDQRVLTGREDILVYQMEPLTERVEVTGNPIVELYASSSAPDTDWFVKLIDVAPDGLARDISSGMVRARYRDGFDKPKLIRSGEIVKYTIRMDATSNAFLPDHRIRLDITSSDFPNFARNHNTAANQNADSTLVTAHQTIYHGGKYATCIILPHIPNPIVKGTTARKDRPSPELEKKTYPLHEAVADGDIERIKDLLLEGVDINSKDEDGNTPLYHAASAGKKEVLQLLVEANADINTGLWWSPLDAAVNANNIEIAEYLLAHGANAQPPRRWTPLVQASYSGNIKMVELLIKAGADVNAGEFKAWNMPISQGRTEVLELLIQKGMDINSEDENGMSPLAVASVNEGKNIIEQLLANGAKINQRNDIYGFTALHYTARFGTTNAAKVLIANGAEIKAKDKWDYQPIHWAAYHDRPDIIELLITKGADVNARTSLCQTPLELAIPRRNTTTIEVLRKHGAKEPKNLSGKNEGLSTIHL